jgi:hypothetical protein
MFAGLWIYPSVPCKLGGITEECHIQCWAVRFTIVIRILTTCCKQEQNEYQMDKFIGIESAEFKELTGQIKQARQNVQDIRDKYRPALMDKRYLSGEEVMEYLHVSPRTLQNLRDSRIIGYTTVGGKILYPEEMIEQVLYQNYQSPELPF